MPDPFVLLPLVLSVFILNGLEDLVSLHAILVAILVASPSAYHVFNVHYTEILSNSHALPFAPIVPLFI